ncbi:MAG: hypothetical protein BM565_13515 [Gammaproteobacteria bacterium MedPE]|nr:MAG: hypothetical protein BM565_13515 [Gammaproteobacteria bacterium MedPE]
MIISRKTVKNVALSLVTVAVLTACHSGKKARTAPPPPTPTPTPTELGIKVADGYLKGAFVYLDVNKNSIFDTGEPSGETGDGGVVTLDTTGIENPDTYPLIAIATVAKTIDEDTNAAVAKDFSLSTPAGNTVINPITTLIQSEITAAQAAGSTLTIAEAIANVAASLGLTDATEAQMLGDYLVDKSTNSFNQQIHAIARSVVQLLPADASGIADALSDQDAVLTAIAQAISDAIAAGGNPDTITIVVKDDGEVETKIPAVDDAKAFVADVRDWGTTIADGFDAPANAFADKADAAEVLIDAQVDSLMDLGGEVLMVVENAIEEDQLEELALADFAGAAAGGTVTVSDIVETDTMMKGMVELDLTFGEQTVKMMVDINAGPVSESTKSDGILMFSATLANADASLELKDGKFEVKGLQLADGDTEESFKDATVELNAMLKASSLKTDTGMFTGNVGAAGKWMELEGETDGVLIPSSLSFGGSFGSGDEKFDASLVITSTGDYDVAANGDVNETTDNWVDATAMLTVEVDMDDFAGAHAEIKIVRTSLDDGTISIMLKDSDDGRKVLLSGKTDDETGQLKATNSDGSIIVAIKTEGVEDGDEVGQVTIGAKVVGTITLVGNVHKITYIDGSFETLF